MQCMNMTRSVGDGNKLAQDMMTLLVALSPMIIQNLQTSVHAMRHDQRAEKAATHSGVAQNAAREQAVIDEPTTGDDSVESYEEKTMENGNLLRHYRNGSVRMENPSSGVIQEERADG